MSVEGTEPQFFPTKEMLDWGLVIRQEIREEEIWIPALSHQTANIQSYKWSCYFAWLTFKVSFCCCSFYDQRLVLTFQDRERFVHYWMKNTVIEFRFFHSDFLESLLFTTVALSLKDLFDMQDLSVATIHSWPLQQMDPYCRYWFCLQVIDSSCGLRDFSEVTWWKSNSIVTIQGGEVLLQSNSMLHFRKVLISHQDGQRYTGNQFSIFSCYFHLLGLMSEETVLGMWLESERY